MDDDAWAAELTAAKARASSTFEKDVLADGKITREEYEEAVTRLTRCMTDRGYPTAAIDAFGTYTYSINGSGEALDMAWQDCSYGNTTIIEPLYLALTINPNNESLYDLHASCFVRRGLADEGFTAEQFREWTEGEPAPNGQAYDSDDVQQCLVNPSYDLTN